MEKGRERSALTRLISVPGLIAVGILGAAVVAIARLFGPGNVLREVVTEVVASFGSTILVLAVFGLLFRTGIERLLRGAPGGESLARSIENLEGILRDLGARELDQAPDPQEPADETTLDRIGKDVRNLTENELPALRKEVAELRALLTRPDHERGD